MGGVAWTEEEDHLLKKCIEQYGEGKWHRIPVLAGLKRCRKSCRLRWLNYLRPNIRRGSFTDDEVLLIIKLHNHLGNRWSLIASRLPGRTANDVKNYWNCHLSKRLDKLLYNDNILTSLIAINNQANFTDKHKLQATELVRGEALTDTQEGKESSMQMEDMYGMELGRANLTDGRMTSTKCAGDETEVDEFSASKFELEEDRTTKAGGDQISINTDNIWDWDELIFDMDLW